MKFVTNEIILHFKLSNNCEKIFLRAYFFVKLLFFYWQTTKHMLSRNIRWESTK